MDVNFFNTDFFNMTPEEAEAYFRAYVESHPKRVEEFRQKVAMEGGPSLEELDYSPESLLPLWTWIIPYIKSWNASENKKETLPGGAYPNTTYFSEYDRLIEGLAAYFAECFLRNVPGLSWTIGERGKRIPNADENQPLLAGFKPKLNPNAIMGNVVSGAKEDNPRNNRPESLLELYRIWEKNALVFSSSAQDKKTSEASSFENENINPEITIRAGKLEVGLYRDDPEAPGMPVKGYDRYDLFFDDDAYAALEDDYDWSEARFDAMDAQLYAKLAELEPRVGVIWEDKEVFFVFIPQEVKDPVGLIKKAVRAMVLRPVPEVELTWWKKKCEERAEAILRQVEMEN